MIGIVIVTHTQLGEALIEAAVAILGKRPRALVAISIDINENAGRLQKKVANGIKAVSRNKGVLVLTDMFGGTPSNLSYSFLEDGKIEVLTGVNLPLLIRAAEIRKKTDISELAKRLEVFGKKSITLASSILKGNKRSE